MSDARRLVEMDAGSLAGARSIFITLQKDAIVVVRNMPEIHELGATLQRLAEFFGGRPNEIEALLQSGAVASIETLAAFHAAFRHLRDSRYLSCLFSDRIATFALPNPMLVDSGFCRMVVPDLIDKVGAHPELFAATGFESSGPGETESMLQGSFWGNPHRDLDARHYHYQINLWFPLHSLEQKRSLLLFPDAYRMDVPQYGQLASPDNPDEWGFGKALQVPLNLGDIFIFHSQQLHASPASRQSRFTVEIRVAAGCADDNGRIYRRLFWNLKNFQGKPGTQSGAIQRAAQLGEAPADVPSIEDALRSETAHGAIHRLFRHSGASLAAGYVRRPAEVFEDAIELDTEGAHRLLELLKDLRSGEDLVLLAARLLLRQGHQRQAYAAIDLICGNSDSYFWNLEAGRIAAEAGAYDLAGAAFRRAEQLAETSPVTLDRYTSNMAPARIPGWVPQLMPSGAKRAARILAQRAQARLDGRQARRRDMSFDYQVVLKPWWKRLISRLLRSKIPHRGLMPIFVRWIWRLRSARRFIRRALSS
jgi:ectoine hydroxylase-related dioxygenase (phytanoyl-CoA dioxygenase family)